MNLKKVCKCTLAGFIHGRETELLFDSIEDAYREKDPQYARARRYTALRASENISKNLEMLKECDFNIEEAKKHVDQIIAILRKEDEPLSVEDYSATHLKLLLLKRAMDPQFEKCKATA